MMNSLFETHTIFTFEEYKKFMEAASNAKQNKLMLASVSVFFVILGITQKTPLLFVLAVAYPLLMMFTQKKGVEKAYKKATQMHDARIDYRFYEDHFVKVFAEAEDQIEYTKLHKIIETKTNFYLMISKTQGFVLVKENMPEGLAEFLGTVKK
ncbi:MAG: YcxB family protein [Oscillospiraceae bacterium]|nr:YcxB family protein [Oscillospiraceae bacterium]